MGADPNAVDSRGSTPLHGAASVGNIQTARTLLEHRARIDAVNNQGEPPLSYAPIRTYSQESSMAMAASIGTPSSSR
ncbi:ankyrin repeat domain-containing protein [Bordetella ansorpii]|uniref:ankyrin repeat domain-containing protein n=1 Tax=Bordetella ansorpii TaxID=288768 RepID=UPI00399F2068